MIWLVTESPSGPTNDATTILTPTAGIICNPCLPYGPDSVSLDWTSPGIRMTK